MARQDAGFTLVEAIAALAIAAIAAAGLMSALGSARGRAAEAEARTVALAQAKRLLADAVQAPDLNQLPRRGQFTTAPTLAWSIALGPKDEPYRGIMQVDVQVSWAAAGRTGETHLAAYRLAPE